MVRVAKSIGLLAARTLQHGRQATVLASFERSFYLDVDGELIAIVSKDLPNGPLNLRSASALTVDFDVALGGLWRVEAGRLIGPDGLAIDFSKASLWEPKTASPIDRTLLAEGLNSLKQQLTQAALPDEGLIRLVLHDAEPANAVEKAAAPAIHQLKLSLRQAFDGSPLDDLQGIQGLLGLGPGLTPSGDDLLGGVLIACHRLGERTAADCLANTVNANAAARTTVISQAHLRAATLGFGAAPLHDLLEAVLTADEKAIADTLDAAAKIGHSSGFDALGGTTLALGSYLGSSAR